MEPTVVRLYADEETYSAGVHLVGAGDSGGMWDVSPGADPTDEARTSLWLDKVREFKTTPLPA